MPATQETVLNQEVEDLLIKQAVHPALFQSRDL
jgi:hypothetical protein